MLVPVTQHGESSDGETASRYGE